MLYHHDSRDYPVAASEAATAARTKFEGLIAKGRASLQTTLERVDAEVPEDYLVPMNRVGFFADQKRIIFDHPLPKTDDTRAEVLHRHALDQVAARAGIPKVYVDRLVNSDDAKRRDLLAYNLTQLFDGDDTKALVRHAGGEIRGVLSDRYKRMDSRQLVQSLLKTAGHYGALPVEGVHLGTRISMKAVLPMVFEPVPNEVLIYGVAWGNSEYGDGAYWLRSFINRLWCTNFATLEEEMRKVHLGKRLQDDVAWSEQTYQLDQATLASMTEDIIGKVFHPDQVKKTMAAITDASTEKIDAKDIRAFLKARLTKSEVAKTEELFASADVEHMPAGQNRWRLSNAISYLAGSLEDAGRRLALEEVAGEALKATA